MEGLTVTGRPAIARARSLEADTIARLVFALLCVAFAIGFFVYPTYPNYDSYYSLLWGRDVVGLHVPNFEGFRVPTEHPLAIAAGMLLSLFGGAGDRLFIAAILASFLWLIWGVYRLGRVAFTPLVGGVAAALLLTRFDFGFLAARGYIDIPYMALVVWAATLEATRSRRGVPVLILLALAGMLRPEAWFLSAMYWVWVSWKATWRQRFLFAAIAASGPLVWVSVDYLVTGDPLFSQHYTADSAEDLGRQRSLSELPSAIPGFFKDLVKLPVFAAAGLGALLGIVISPRRMLMPIALLLAGVVTFLAIGVAGASVIERYLAVPALALMVLAAVTVAGWTMLSKSWVRTVWMVAAGVIVLAGVGYQVTHLNLSRFDNELRFRGQAHTDLTSVLKDPQVQAGLRCGPLTGPNHKIVPDSRWIADLGDGKVWARAESYRDDRDVPLQTKGVAIVVTSRFAIFKHAWTDVADDARIQVPPPGFKRVKTSRFYAAYVRC